VVDMTRTAGTWRSRCSRIFRAARRLLGLAGPPARFAGSLEGVRDGAIHGWARDAGLPDGRTDVILETDTGRTLVVPADLMRGDVRAAGFGDGYHGFRVSLARLGPGVCRVTARPAASERPLAGSPLRLAGATPEGDRPDTADAASAQSSVRPLDLGRWQGRLDPSRPGVVSGWLVDTEEPGRRPMVELRDGEGLVLARDRACRWRPDAPAATGDRMVGFEMAVGGRQDADGRDSSSNVSIAVDRAAISLPLATTRS
jgi:hypothetical protein